MISNSQKALVFGVLVLMFVGSVSAELGCKSTGDGPGTVTSLKYLHSCDSIRCSDNVDYISFCSDSSDCTGNRDCVGGTCDYSDVECLVDESQRVHGTYIFKTFTSNDDIRLWARDGNDITITSTGGDININGPVRADDSGNILIDSATELSVTSTSWFGSELGSIKTKSGDITMTASKDVILDFPGTYAFASKGFLFIESRYGDINMLSGGLYTDNGNSIRIEADKGRHGGEGEITLKPTGGIGVGHTTLFNSNPGAITIIGRPVNIFDDTSTTDDMIRGKSGDITIECLAAQYSSSIPVGISTNVPIRNDNSNDIIFDSKGYINIYSDSWFGSELGSSVDCGAIEITAREDVTLDFPGTYAYANDGQISINSAGNRIDMESGGLYTDNDHQILLRGGSVNLYLTNPIGVGHATLFNSNPGLITILGKSGISIDGSSDGVIVGDKEPIKIFSNVGGNILTSLPIRNLNEGTIEIITSGDISIVSNSWFGSKLGGSGKEECGAITITAGNDITLDFPDSYAFADHGKMSITAGGSLEMDSGGLYTNNGNPLTLTAEDDIILKLTKAIGAGNPAGGTHHTSPGAIAITGSVVSIADHDDWGESKSLEPAIGPLDVGIFGGSGPITITSTGEGQTEYWTPGSMQILVSVLSNKQPITLDSAHSLTIAPNGDFGYSDDNPYKKRFKGGSITVSTDKDLSIYFLNENSRLESGNGGDIVIDAARNIKLYDGRIKSAGDIVISAFELRGFEDAPIEDSNVHFEVPSDKRIDIAHCKSYPISQIWTLNDHFIPSVAMAETKKCPSSCSGWSTGETYDGALYPYCDDDDVPSCPPGQICQIGVDGWCTCSAGVVTLCAEQSINFCSTSTSTCALEDEEVCRLNDAGTECECIYDGALPPSTYCSIDPIDFGELPPGGSVTFPVGGTIDDCIYNIDALRIFVVYEGGSQGQLDLSTEISTVSCLLGLFGSAVPGYTYNLPLEVDSSSNLIHDGKIVIGLRVANPVGYPSEFSCDTVFGSTLLEPSCTIDVDPMFYSSKDSYTVVTTATTENIPVGDSIEITFDGFSSVTQNLHATASGVVDPVSHAFYSVTTGTTHRIELRHDGEVLCRANSYHFGGGGDGSDYNPVGSTIIFLNGFLTYYDTGTYLNGHVTLTITIPYVSGWDMGHSINAEVINGQLNVVLGESTPIIMTLLQKYDIEVVVNDGINIATFNMEYTR